MFMTGSMLRSRVRLPVGRSHSSLDVPYLRAGMARTDKRISSPSGLSDEELSRASTLKVPIGSKAFPTTLDGLMEQINRSSFTSSLTSVSNDSDSFDAENLAITNI
ncbi:uncharacterized protein LOC135462439 [Liolophura sinensis]|uniref:uncharacterized protein LOC135462439 n=1 Tax=Liolophura sinensis TaxID=3198878 RepID=UPI0031592993